MTDAQYCIEYFYAKEGCRDQLVQSLLKLIEPTRSELGCLQYELIQDSKNPLLVILIVKFSNQELMKKHEEQDYIQQFTANEMERYCEKFHWNEGREIIHA